MKRFLLDTNVVVRFLLGEVSTQGQAAASFFAKSDCQEYALILEPLVLAETVFVLTSFYKKPREAVADALGALLQSPGIECEARSVALRALVLFKAHPQLHWVDCFLGAVSIDTGLPVASFDTDFDRVQGVTRHDPVALA